MRRDNTAMAGVECTLFLLERNVVNVVNDSSFRCILAPISE